MFSFHMFIGANNDTNEVELDVIRDVLDHEVDAYTIIPALGVWKGTHEDSILVMTSTDTPEDANELMKALAYLLEQDAIGWHEAPAMNFVSA